MAASLTSPEGAALTDQQGEHFLLSLPTELWPPLKWSMVAISIASCQVVHLRCRGAWRGVEEESLVASGWRLGGKTAPSASQLLWLTAKRLWALASWSQETDITDERMTRRFSSVLPEDNVM